MISVGIFGHSKSSVGWLVWRLVGLWDRMEEGVSLLFFFFLFFPSLNTVECDNFVPLFVFFFLFFSTKYTGMSCLDRFLALHLVLLGDFWRKP